MDFFYNYIFLPIALLFVKYLKKYNKKLLIRESNVFKSWENLKDLPDNKIRIWFHAASMGEFEQAKPVIELLKKELPDIFIIASFFSPSGFNSQQNYKLIDRICYIPLDKKQWAKQFINLIRPNFAVFVRYEIWRNHLLELKAQHIPIYLINATKPSNKFFAHSFIARRFIKSNMHLFNRIFTIGESHSNYFVKLGLRYNVHTLSDTRFDRICKFVKESGNFPIIPKLLFDENELILVAGSIWEQDEDILIPAIQKVKKDLNVKLRTIYVLHEPTKENIERLTNKLGNYVLFSKLASHLKTQSCHILSEQIKDSDIVVDSIGYLLRLYGVGNFAYIGGAFGEGVHSVTEAAGYGLPIATGPNLTKSTDAQILKQMSVLASVKNANNLERWIKQMCINTSLRLETGIKAKDYIFQSAGSSKIIVRRILHKLKRRGIIS